MRNNDSAIKILRLEDELNEAERTIENLREVMILNTHQVIGMKRENENLKREIEFLRKEVENER